MSSSGLTTVPLPKQQEQHEQLCHRSDFNNKKPSKTQTLRFRGRVRLNTRTSVHARAWLEAQTSQPKSIPLFREAQSRCLALAAPWQVALVPAVTGLRHHRHRVRRSFLFPCLPGAHTSPAAEREVPDSPQGDVFAHPCATGSVTAPGPPSPRSSEDEGNGLGNPFFGKARETNLPDRALRWEAAKARSEPQEGQPCSRAAAEHRPRSDGTEPPQPK